MKNKDYFISRICNEILLDDISKVFSIFLYGSRVYENHTSNSDYDFIIIKNQIEDKIDGLKTDDNLINCTSYSFYGFKKYMFEHELSLLECLFLSENMIYTNIFNFNFSINKEVLRNSISQKSSNSWIKAKKKLDDKEFYIAQKSLFHSIRIVLFGIQLAKYNKIVDYTEANFIWLEIKDMDLDWNIWKEKYHSYRNKLLSEFRILAPK